ncbi:galactosyl transferase GMA12/MNN10 family protein [Penicillium malachiteum]|uniref:galactosyl transferase GMA12/MNN10 family protein n=1 Tax=Penicillium malachiteum TaxID=1324776 RepID=UPI0025487BE7|nr:galactosyl transferase GMA12/MNN10 family protein [Penicillium malachiteum]KAJ5726493.1 galactosyl transferase GMA12/MNN10 family protein [Penicillium malachiteum]
MPGHAYSQWRNKVKRLFMSMTLVGLGFLMLSNFFLNDSPQKILQPPPPAPVSSSAVKKLLEEPLSQEKPVPVPNVESSTVALTRPRVGKVSMIYGDRPIYNRALASHEEHSRRHNYPMSILRTPIIDRKWNKYLILLSTVLRELEKPEDERWFDSDTVLMNLNLPLEVFLPPPNLPDVHMLVSQDQNGINNGVFFIRVHSWSFELLNSALAYPRLNKNTQLPFGDQSALGKVLEENEYFSQSVVYCPSRWFNPYRRSENGELPQTEALPKSMVIHPGDLLVHFAGTADAGKLEEAMRPYIEISEQRRPDWNVPLENTHYVKQAALFWDTHVLPKTEDTDMLLKVIFEGE